MTMRFQVRFEEESGKCNSQWVGIWNTSNCFTVQLKFKSNSTSLDGGFSSSFYTILLRSGQLYILTPNPRPLIHANCLLESEDLHLSQKLKVAFGNLSIFMCLNSHHMHQVHVCVCICVFWLLIWQFPLTSLFASCKPKMKCLTALLSCMYFDMTTVNGFPMCPVEYILPYWQPYAYVKSIFFASVLFR